MDRERREGLDRALQGRLGRLFAHSVRQKRPFYPPVTSTLAEMSEAGAGAAPGFPAPLGPGAIYKSTNLVASHLRDAYMVPARRGGSGMAGPGTADVSLTGFQTLTKASFEFTNGALQVAALTPTAYVKPPLPVPGLFNNLRAPGVEAQRKRYLNLRTFYFDGGRGNGGGDGLGLPDRSKLETLAGSVGIELEVPPAHRVSLLQEHVLKQVNLSADAVRVAKQRETASEALIGYYMNMLVLARYSPGVSLLLDWYQGPHLKAPFTEEIATQIASNPEETEQADRYKSDWKNEAVSYAWKAAATWDPQMADLAAYRDLNLRRRDTPASLSAEDKQYLSTLARRRQFPAPDQFYLVMERQSNKLNTYIPSQLTRKDRPTTAIVQLRAILAQTCVTLELAWRVFGFVHYDMHAGNVTVSHDVRWPYERAKSKDLGWQDTLFQELDEIRHFVFSLEALPQEEGPTTLWIPAADSGFRLARLIDFGRSRLWASDDESRPLARNQLLGVDIPGLGILRAQPQRQHDLRTLAFDLATRAFDRGIWQTLENQYAKSADGKGVGALVRSVRLFLARAIDLPEFARQALAHWRRLEKELSELSRTTPNLSPRDQQAQDNKKQALYDLVFGLVLQPNREDRQEQLVRHLHSLGRPHKDEPDRQKLSDYEVQVHNRIYVFLRNHAVLRIDASSPYAAGVTPGRALQDPLFDDYRDPKTGSSARGRQRAWLMTPRQPHRDDGLVLFPSTPGT